jgi:hypothetical protein
MEGGCRTKLAVTEDTARWLLPAPLRLSIGWNPAATPFARGGGGAAGCAQGGGFWMAERQLRVVVTVSALRRARVRLWEQRGGGERMAWRVGLFASLRRQVWEFFVPDR